MTCASCGHDNRAGRKFCVECGATSGAAAPRPPVGLAIEHIALNKVDADGGLRAVMRFDPNDRDAAFLEELCTQGRTDS